MDQDLKVPVSTLTQTFANLAKRTSTRAEKHYLFGITEGVATAIANQKPGFDTDEFIRECGVNPEWATIAA